MNWDSLADLLHMGGYGLYVWSAYVMVGVALAWEALVLQQRRYRAVQDLREQAIDRAVAARGAQHAA